MIKQILQKTLIQPKQRYTFFKIWSWIYAKSNEQNIYYGNAKDICLNCEVEYSDINKALELQYQWNTKEHEQTVVLRKEKIEFTAQHNYYIPDNYFKLFEINLIDLPSAYHPIIIIFNPLDYKTMSETNDNAKNLQTSMNLGDENSANKENKKSKKKTKKTTGKGDKNIDVNKQLINVCLDIYREFCMQHLGIDPPNLKFDPDDKYAKGLVGSEVNALKSIIKYLRGILKAEESNDAGIINSFDMILRNWNRYSSYHQAQYKLRQINSNLINLIGEIKKRPKEMDTSKSAKALEFSKQMDEFVKAGGLKTQLSDLGKREY